MYYLGQKGYSIKKECLSIQEQNKIRDDLTVKPFSPPNSIQKPSAFPIYRESPKKFYVPRFYGISNFGDPDFVSLNEGKNIDVTFQGSMRDYQNTIVDCFFDKTKVHGCGLLEIPCGRGKTVMALNILARLKKKTLVIVHKEFLLNQWIERIHQFIPDAKIGKIQGPVVDIEGKDIVIGMLQSLSMKEYGDLEFHKEFGFTIIDETHHISAEVFSRSLFKIVTKHMLGLSATMNRKDGLSKVFKMFLGDIVYKEKRQGDDKVLVRKVNYRSSDPDFSQTVYNFKGQTHYSLMIRKLCEFSHRSEFILKILGDMLRENPDQQIMILAHNKNVLKYLHDAIEHREMATVGYYVGGMKEAALKETESKKVVIATYAMAEEALDIKSLASLILVTPKTDVTQAVGRILRMKHPNPIVVDVVDQHDVFQKQWVKRRRFYMKCKYKIQEIDSNKYNNDFENWEILYNADGNEKKYKKKIAKKDKPPLLSGKCMLKIDTSELDKK